MSDDLIGLHVEHLQSAGTPESTVQGRRELLSRLNDRLDFGLIYATTEQLEAWLAELQRAKRAKATLKLYRYHVQQFYMWACASGYQDGNPAATLKGIRVPRGVPKPVSEEELAELLLLPEPFKTAVVLGAFEGMRRAEIAAAEREDINEDVTLIPHGKGDKPGVIPTHPFVWNHVKDRPNGPLITENGLPFDPRHLGSRCTYIFDKAGLHGVHLHRLRHRYGTVIQELYGDIRVTQECLRHESLNSTMGYTLVTGARRAAAVAALPVPGATGPASL